MLAANAFNRGHDRLRTRPHRLDEVAGHAGELEQARDVHAGQWADDLVHVAAGGEVTAGPGHHHRLAVLRVDEFSEEIAHLRVGFEG